MTPTTSGTALRVRRSSRLPARFALYPMALLGLVTALVVAAPLAESAPVVTLAAPFSGTPFQTISYYHQGCGSNLVVHDLLFSASTGRAHLNQESNAKMCKSTKNVLTIVQTNTDTGLNSTTFSPATTVALAHVKVHWGLTYNWYMGATLGNSSQTTYSSFTVDVLATIYDTTTGTTYLPTNAYSTGVTISDVNGTSLNHITAAPAELFFNLSLSSTHLYQFNTSLEIVTTVDTIGPQSSAFVDVLFYDPVLSDRANLNWVMY
ncbi:MAG: hypothetical protein L3K00_06090 [Thermoplasmata archaeon]|nr:hypothetical protein [Thermoplasmata archaeon]MCI4362347.1 hypothetical protein [Thermoplasmata archaeon]